MEQIKNEIIKYVELIPEEKIGSVLDYVRYIYEKGNVVVEEDYPLDDFDYELAKKAETYDKVDTIPLDDILHEYGLTYEDL